MKAIVLNGPGGDYCYSENYPFPEAPTGWAIVKTAYCGICGSDIPRFASLGSYHHPMVLGHEFSGTVEVPAQNGCLKKGEKVAILPIIPCGDCEGCAIDEPFHCKQYQFIGSRNDGGMAEYCAVPESNLFLLPESTDLLEGSFIEPMLVGLNAVRRSGFSAGESAVVFGAGPIGLLLACWLRVLGASRIVISDLREFSINKARECGFSDIFNPLTDELAPLGRFDHAFEAAGSGKALQTAIELLGIKGTLTVVGRDVKDTIIPVAVFEKLMRKEVTLNGCWGYKIKGEEELIYRTLHEKSITPSLLCSHKISLSKAPGTIDDMINKRMEYCKVVIETGI